LKQRTITKGDVVEKRLRTTGLQAMKNIGVSPKEPYWSSCTHELDILHFST